MSELKMLLITGIGGFIGAGMRYYISGLLTKGNFPYGTLFVNMIGSFFLSLILFMSFYSGYNSSYIRVFLTIGLLGAFTTMSTFSFETVEFLNNKEYIIGIANIISNVGLSILGIYLGKAVAIILS